MRLVGGSSASEGRVEVCINETYGTICDNGWTTNDANVICGQLGYLTRGQRARPLEAKGLLKLILLLQVLWHTPMLDLDRAPDQSSTATWRALEAR